MSQNSSSWKHALRGSRVMRLLAPIARPADRIPPGRLRVLAAICLLAEDGPVKLRALIARCGLASPNGVLQHLNELERHGLISRERRRAGTIRPLVRWVPVEELA